MIENQINLDSSINKLRMKCYVCNKTGHLVNECNILHYCPDKEKVIKQNDYFHMQDRQSFVRRKNKRAQYKIYNYKPLKALLFQTKSSIYQTFDNDSDEEYYEEIAQENKENQENKEYQENKENKEEKENKENQEIQEINEMKEIKEMKESNEHKENNKLNNENIIIFPKIPDKKNSAIAIDKKGSILERRSFLGDENLNSTKPRISITKYEEENNPLNRSLLKQHTGKSTFSRTKTNDSRGSFVTKSVQFLPAPTSSTSIPRERETNEENEPKRKSIIEKDTFWINNTFETVHNFSNFFTKHNISQIQKIYNKNQNASYHIVQAKKLIEMKKFCKYTFYFIKMYECNKRRRGRKFTRTNLKKPSRFAFSNEKNSGMSFLDLVKMKLKASRENKKSSFFTKIKKFIDKFSHKPDANERFRMSYLN